MHDIKTVEIHVGSVSGPLVAKGGETGDIIVNLPLGGKLDFVLVDVTSEKHRFLSIVTIGEI